MPGLLDLFSPDDPMKQQGLLAAAAAILQGAGDPRQPFGFGQAAGAGIGAYQQSLAQQQQLSQQKTLRDLQIKAAQGDLDQHQAAIDMQNRIRQREMASIQALPQGAAPTASAPPVQPIASAAPGIGPMSPQVGGLDSPQSSQAQNPPAMAGAPAPQPPANLTQQVMALLTRSAQNHALEGDVDGANKLYEQATKFMPEVNKIEVGMSNGKPVNVITYKDGRQEVSQFAPKPDIHFADDGQHTAIPMDGYTGKSLGPGMQRFATPDTVLNNRSSAARLNFDRQQAAAEDQPAKPNETMAKQIAFYKAAPLGQFSLNKPWGQATMDRVMELNPQYDAAQYAPRASALRAYGAGGKEALGIDSINIGMNHVATLRELALAQKNGNVPLFNKIANQYAQQTGQPAPTNLRMAADMVAPEVVKAVAGVSGTGEERAHFAKSLTGDGTYAPDQIIGATGEVQNLFAGRLSEKKRSYERSTQLDNFDSMLSPAALGLLKQKSAPDVASAAAPKKSALPGQIVRGYKFKGGDPSVQSNWEKM